MRWAGHVAHRGEVRNVKSILFETLKGGNHAEALGLCGRIMLNRISGKLGGKVWTVFIWLR